MNLTFYDDKPIYLQMSRWIEENILSGAFAEEEQIPSTTDISSSYRINPATALKGINILVDKGIVYKKRGLGMFVCKGAADKLRMERKREFCEKYVFTLLDEAKKLGISKEEIIAMITKGDE